MHYHIILQEITGLLAGIFSYAALLDGPMRGWRASTTSFCAFIKVIFSWASGLGEYILPFTLVEFGFLRISLNALSL